MEGAAVAAAATAAPADADQRQQLLITHLSLLDPLLQFLTKATSRNIVPLLTLRKTFPPGSNAAAALCSVPELARRGVLLLGTKRKDDECGFNDNVEQLYTRFAADAPPNDVHDSSIFVGFHPKPGHHSGGGSEEDFVPLSVIGMDGNGKVDASTLHGSTKAGAKRRLAALKKSFRKAEGGATCKRKKSAGGKSKASAGNKHESAKKRLSKTMMSDEKNDNDNDNACADSIAMKSREETELQMSKAKGIEDVDNTESGDNPADASIVSRSTSDEDDSSEESQEATEAFNCLKSMMGIKEKVTNLQSKGEEEEKVGGLAVEPLMLPNQAKFAGSSPARQVQYGYLSQSARECIPTALVDAMNLDIGQNCQRNLYSFGGNSSASSPGRRRLYKHQQVAVDSILNGTHTTICTGTGSGKSLCFLLPVLATIMKTDIDAITSAAFSSETTLGSAAIVMFPTKALAQDQSTKLQSLVKSHPLLMDHIRPGVIDGDTPHSARADIAEHCNIILTNPDTIHAAILPNWKKTYSALLAKIRFVVVDESHTYEGAFGANCSLVLRRLLRVCDAAYYTNCATDVQREKVVFVSCSATMGRPESHFRLLCPIDEDDKVTVLNATEDSSPCGSKYFFTWTPPLLDVDGKSSGRLSVPRKREEEDQALPTIVRPCGRSASAVTDTNDSGTEGCRRKNRTSKSNRFEAGSRRSPLHRRHAADETARLLAAAVRNGVRCIAFCKTRSICEWVYERCIANLRSGNGGDLSSKVESYRGGYTAEARRNIEARLFQEKLVGVVATSALELGVDIGGIDLTLHCGYPGSISSLMQQSGRAGRGGKPSVSIMICFASPAEQHFWRFPQSLLSRGLDVPPSIPVNTGILQGHLLCAGEEYPLVGDHSVVTLLTSNRENPIRSQLTDQKLFSSDVFDEALEKLVQSRLLAKKSVTLRMDTSTRNSISQTPMVVKTFSTHPSVDKPWSRVSLRSIEPISYSIVDINHNLQGGKTDTIHERAVLDTIPYSRVFYHAFPGAVIQHRGRRYKVDVMNAPPPFADCTIGYCRSIKLGAFAKQTSVSYSTQALALTHITVVKQFERIELLENDAARVESTDSTSVSTSPPTNATNITAATSNADADISSNVSSSKTASRSDVLYKHPELHKGTVAGNGVVTVKRTVHGYKKVSPINRKELSRHELKMPSMEFDTNALWIDCEANLLTGVITDFDAGVHALSHALLAVSPLFVPCAASDIDCDHSTHDCTRVMLLDSRAGGAGIVSRLWEHFFRPRGMLASAIDLLEHCSTCSEDSGFKGGCPSCLQSVPCINFHEEMSRPAGLYIARRILKRIEHTELFKKNASNITATSLSLSRQISQQPALSTPERSTKSKKPDTTPRRRARKRALNFAKDLESAKKRSVVVGRPTWPADERL